MNLPNKITLSRTLLIIPIWILGSFLNFYSFLAIVILGFFICLGDLLDGYLARKYNLITDFGKFFDPIADKVFSITAFIFFASAGMMPFAVVSIIVARELLVCFIRILGGQGNNIIEADFWGKMKSFSQNIAISLFAFVMLHHLYKIEFQTAGIIDEGAVKFALLDPLLYLTLALTVLSFFNYVDKNRGIFKDC